MVPEKLRIPSYDIEENSKEPVKLVMEDDVLNNDVGIGSYEDNYELRNSNIIYDNDDDIDNFERGDFSQYVFDDCENGNYDYFVSSGNDFASQEATSRLKPYNHSNENSTNKKQKLNAENMSKNDDHIEKRSVSRSLETLVRHFKIFFPMSKKRSADTQCNGLNISSHNNLRCFSFSDSKIGKEFENFSMGQRTNLLPDINELHHKSNSNNIHPPSNNVQIDDVCNKISDNFEGNAHESLIEPTNNSENLSDSLLKTHSLHNKTDLEMDKNCTYSGKTDVIENISHSSNCNDENFEENGLYEDISNNIGNDFKGRQCSESNNYLMPDIPKTHLETQHATENGIDQKNNTIDGMYNSENDFLICNNDVTASSISSTTDEFFDEVTTSGMVSNISMENEKIENSINNKKNKSKDLSFSIACSSANEFTGSLFPEGSFETFNPETKKNHGKSMTMVLIAL
ncbi:hypothetical protein HELRODRAFT_169143 [Helobdella robusta]|uniref:Uncharacterized protein n=1 Tax=Helobdella robusta TaxID=6412 RepID=T1F1G6_HELRO|nr:hypothetical protein HELRODRAFT_169143 [Helobdella robusta]ESO08333.1 hypothetical protein HELRODRAFT_169143 [Helobdella robusta]